MSAEPADARFVPSRYLVIGDRELRSAGRPVRPVHHTATARSFLVDPHTARRLVGERPPHWTAEAEHRLARAGLLVPEGTDEAAAVLAASRAAARDARTRTFVVMPTSYCNMGCTYCGQEHRRGVTGARHRSALAARVSAAAGSGEYDAVRVGWFGGEPMMGYAVVRDLSRSFLAAVEDGGLRYSARMVTNGALLSPRKLRTLVEECRVTEIEVTLDGPRDAHDAGRVLKSGGKSFDHITTVLAEAVPALPDLRVTLRTNIGVHNAGLAEPFAAAVAEAGLAHPRVTCYPAPIHQWGNDVSDVAVGLAELARTELVWFDAYARHGLTTTLLPRATKPVVCAAVNPHAEVIAPDGAVFSCTEQPLVPAFADRAVATLDELGTAARPRGDFDDWHDAVAAGESPCRSCVLLPECGGACPKLWREGAPPCPPLKLNLKERLERVARDMGCEG